MSPENETIIYTKKSGLRIDKFLAEVCEVSRSRVQYWIKEGQVLVDGSEVKANYKLKNGQTITLNRSEIEQPQQEPQPEEIPLDILYEDEEILAVNKPSGLVVHSAAGHRTGTLVHALLYHTRDLSDLNGDERPGIVHRLDRDTSGCLLIAKTNHAHKQIADQFKNRTVDRMYHAIVSGILPHNEGTIDAPIGRDPSHRKQMTVTNEHSKSAKTHFTVLKRYRGYTYVACKLETGRTHQIRVHMKYIGFPIIGDPVYGIKQPDLLARQALHAKHLCFLHPKTGNKKIIEAPLPKDFQLFLDGLT